MTQAAARIARPRPWHITFSRAQFTDSDAAGCVSRQETFTAAGGVACNMFVLASSVGEPALADQACNIAAESIIRVIQQAAKDEHTTPVEWLREGLIQANQAVATRTLRSTTHNISLTGATLIAALVIDGRAWIANVGDSRAYLFRDGRAEKFTTEHTRNGLLTQFLGNKATLPPIGADAADGRFIFEASLGSTDHLLLCTAGVDSNGKLPDIPAADSADRVARALAGAVKERGMPLAAFVIQQDLARRIPLALLVVAGLLAVILVIVIGQMVSNAGDIPSRPTTAQGVGSAMPTPTAALAALPDQITPTSAILRSTATSVPPVTPPPTATSAPKPTNAPPIIATRTHTSTPLTSASAKPAPTPPNNVLAPEPPTATPTPTIMVTATAMWTPTPPAATATRTPVPLTATPLPPDATINSSEIPKGLQFVVEVRNLEPNEPLRIWLNRTGKDPERIEKPKKAGADGTARIVIETYGQPEGPCSVVINRGDTNRPIVVKFTILPPPTSTPLPNLTPIVLTPTLGQ